MREYKREEIKRTETGKEAARSVKKRIGAKEVTDAFLIFALAVILLVFAVVVVCGIDVREIPKAIAVSWCIAVAYVITWATNWGDPKKGKSIYE